MLDAAEQGDLSRVKALIEKNRDDPGYINACDKMGASGMNKGWTWGRENADENYERRNVYETLCRVLLS